MNQNQNPAEILNWEIENIIDADTFEYLDKKHYQKTPPTLNINIPYSEELEELILNKQNIKASIFITKSVTEILAPTLTDLNNIYHNIPLDEPEKKKDLIEKSQDFLKWWGKHKIVGTIYVGFASMIVTTLIIGVVTIVKAGV